MPPQHPPGPLDGSAGAPPYTFYVHHDAAHNTYHLTSDISAHVHQIRTADPAREILLRDPRKGRNFDVFLRLPRPADYPDLPAMDKEALLQHISERMSATTRPAHGWSDILELVSQEWVHCLQSLRTEQDRIPSKAKLPWTAAKTDEVVVSFTNWVNMCLKDALPNLTACMTSIAALEDNDAMRELLAFKAARKKDKNGKDRVPEYLRHATTKVALLERLVDDSKVGRLAHQVRVHSVTYCPSLRDALTLHWASSVKDTVGEELARIITLQEASLTAAQQRLEQLGTHYNVPVETFKQSPVSWAKPTWSWISTPIAQRAEFGELIRQSLDDDARAAATTRERSTLGVARFDAVRAHGLFIQQERFGTLNATDSARTSKRQREGKRAKARRLEWEERMQQLSRPRRGSESGTDLPWKRTPAESEILFGRLKSLGVLRSAIIEEDQESKHTTVDRPGSAGGVPLPPLPKTPESIDGFYEAIKADLDGESELNDQDCSTRSDGEGEKAVHEWATRTFRSASF